jgi:sugar phosphate isomerase/epimerase
MKLTDVIRPGLMISNADPESRKVEGQTLAVLEQAVELDFFEAYQTVEVPYAAERQGIAECLKANNLSLTYCLARVLNENKFYLSSLDDESRSKSVEGVIPHLDDAAEQGADAVAIISGPAEPDEQPRATQLKQFEKSMLQLCEAANKRQLKVVVEPLDTRAHKKKAVGLSGEAAQMCRRVKQQTGNMYLCLDTSHMILNGEDVIAEVDAAMDCIDEFHICNPVLKKDDPKFGDTHIKFGEPGQIDLEEIGRIFARCVEIGFFTTSRRPKMFLEVKNQNEEVIDVIKYCKQTMLDAWEIACSKFKAGVK